MAIDFDELKEKVLEDCNDEETKLVDKDIEILKAMSKEKIEDMRQVFFFSVNEAITEYDSPMEYDSIQDELLGRYLKENADESEDDYDDDKFEEFRAAKDEKCITSHGYTFSREESMLIELVHHGGAMRDNLYDECMEKGFSDVAEGYSFSGIEFVKKMHEVGII